MMKAKADPSDKFSEADKKKLKGLAQEIAQEACFSINLRVANLDTPTMPYKNQCVLEYLIQILKESV